MTGSRPQSLVLVDQQLTADLVSVFRQLPPKPVAIGGRLPEECVSRRAGLTTCWADWGLPCCEDAHRRGIALAKPDVGGGG